MKVLFTDETGKRHNLEVSNQTTNYYEVEAQIILKTGIKPNSIWQSSGVKRLWGKK